MVNDGDFDEHSSTVSESCSQAITDTSLGRLSYDAIEVAQQLVITQTTFLDAGLWQRRMEVASRFREHVHDSYMRLCNLSNPFHRLVHAVARTMVYSIMLRAVRPSQSDVTLQPPRVDDPRVLSIAVRCLRASEEAYIDSGTRRWGWMVWIQWHALAVALAGLCVIREKELVQEAWIWVEAAFARYPSNIADAAEGMLWTPMKKLYQKALAFQRESVVEISRDSTLSYDNLPPFVSSDLALDGVDSSLHIDPELLERMVNDAAVMDSNDSNWILASIQKI